MAFLTTNSLVYPSTTKAVNHLFSEIAKVREKLKHESSHYLYTRLGDLLYFKGCSVTEIINAYPDFKRKS